MYIEKINSPADVKALSVEQMEVLATEVRQALLHKLNHCSALCVQFATR